MLKSESQKLSLVHNKVAFSQTKRALLYSAVSSVSKRSRRKTEILYIRNIHGENKLKKMGKNKHFEQCSSHSDKTAFHLMALAPLMKQKLGLEK